MLRFKNKTLLIVLLSAFCLLPAVLRAQTKVTLADTLYGPTGQALSGTIVVTNNATFTAADGTVVPKGTIATIPVTRGAFTVALVPNVGSSPAGTSYNASYRLGSVYLNETWVVPASGPVTLADVRASSTPTPTTLITASQLPAFTGDTTTSAGSTFTTTTKVNGTAFPASPAVNELPLVTSADQAAWTLLPNCADAAGAHLNYDNSAHTFSCGTSNGSFSTLTGQATASQLPATINASALQDKGGQVFNVKAYGAACDGSTDDAAALDAAYTGAAAVHGEVFLPAGTCARSTAWNISSQVNIRGAGKASSVLFTGATDGLVFTSGANFSSVKDLTIEAGNASSGKAINLNGASDMVFVNVFVTSDLAPAHTWVNGIYLFNALLNRFFGLNIVSATVPIDLEGDPGTTFSNSNDFASINITNNIASATYVTINGGTPTTFIGGEIEGNASSALMSITNSSWVTLLGTKFENAHATGAGVDVEGGILRAYSLGLSVAATKGIILGSTTATKWCKIYGGSGASWTLGANASMNLITGFSFSGAAPVDNSTAGTNTLFDNNNTAGGYLASTFAEPINATNSVILPDGKFIGWVNTNNGFYSSSAGALVKVRVGGAASQYWEAADVGYYLPIRFAQYSFANLPASAFSGYTVYCTDCKNVADDAVTFDSNAAAGGHGTLVVGENGAWRVH